MRDVLFLFDFVRILKKVISNNEWVLKWRWSEWVEEGSEEEGRRMEECEGEEWVREIRTGNF